MEERKGDYVFKAFNFIFDILTFGWIAEIFMVFGITAVLFLFLAITKNKTYFGFLVADRWRFALHYIIHFVRQKKAFLKGLYGVMSSQVKKVLFIGGSFLLFAIVIVWILAQYL